MTTLFSASQDAPDFTNNVLVLVRYHLASSSSPCRSIQQRFNLLNEIYIFICGQFELCALLLWR
jgi:hypothetical protein